MSEKLLLRAFVCAVLGCALAFSATAAGAAEINTSSLSQNGW